MTKGQKKKARKKVKKERAEVDARADRLLVTGHDHVTRTRFKHSHTRPDGLCYVCGIFPVIDKEPEYEGKERDASWRSADYCFLCLEWGVRLNGHRLSLSFEDNLDSWLQVHRADMYEKCMNDHDDEWPVRIDEMRARLKIDDYWRRRGAPQPEWEKDKELRAYHEKKGKEMAELRPTVVISEDEERETGESEGAVLSAPSASSQ